MTEKRPHPRRRVLKAGIIAFNDRQLTASCTVRDLSGSGARLQVSGSIGAPDRFVLIIEIDGLEADCEVVRRQGNELGVKFLSPPRQGTPRRSQVVTPLVPEATPSLRRKPKPA